MTKNDERCLALAARQAAAYEAMRRKGLHLFAPIDNRGLPRGQGKEYKPALTKPTPQEPLPNVTKLRRRA